MGTQSKKAFKIQVNLFGIKLSFETSILHLFTVALDPGLLILEA
jgi:hypothetical protein